MKYLFKNGKSEHKHASYKTKLQIPSQIPSDM